MQKLNKFFLLSLIFILLQSFSFAAEPTSLPTWDENETNTLPITTEQQEDGFVYNSRPASGTFNSWFRNVYKWTEWFQEKFSQAESVDNIADLRAITYTPEDGQVVNILGYYTKTENRDWKFQWDSTSTDTDDGGATIKVTGIETGRFKRLFTNTNASFFGYGSTRTASENTTAVQAALDSIDQGTVIIPSGSCDITSIIMPENTELVFEKDAIFVGTTDVNIITITKNTRLVNPQVNASGISGFSHACIYLYGDPTLTSRKHITQIINPRLFGSDLQDGYGIHFDASDADDLKISYVEVLGGHIDLFERAIFLDDNDDYTGYVTGNMFIGLFLSGNDYNLYVAESNGNIFDNIQIQPTTTLTRQIYCSGSFNTFDNMFFWDVSNTTTIELTETSSQNLITNISAAAPISMIDNGSDNTVDYAYGGLTAEKKPRITGHENYNTKNENFLLYAHNDHTVTQSSGTAPVTGTTDSIFTPLTNARWNVTSTYPIVIEVEFAVAQHNIQAIGARFTALYEPSGLSFEVYNSSTLEWLEWFSNADNTDNYVISAKYAENTTYGNNVEKVRITLDGVNATTSEIRLEDFILIQRHDKAEGKKYLSRMGGNVYGSVGAEDGFKTGNSEAVGTLGSATLKMEIFDMDGVSIGFIPIYN